MYDESPPPARHRALQQHPNFAAALAALGRPAMPVEGTPPLYLMRRRITPGITVSMISRPDIRPTDLSERLQNRDFPRGPLLIAPEAAAPEWRAIALPLMTPASIAEMDLSAGPEELRARQHQKWRNRLCHAERQGLTLTASTKPLKGDHWLLRAESAQRKARRYRTWPLALTRAYMHANPDQFVTFTAREKSEPVAAMLFLRHGRSATYHIGHITERGRAKSAHNLILWRALLWLRREGHGHLDLGTVDTVNAPGLARFKCGVGANVRRLGGTWLYWPPLSHALRPLAWLDRHAMTG